MKHAVHFSSASDCWQTPRDFFEALDREFGFSIDICALPETAMLPRYCCPPTGAEYHILWPGTAFIDGLSHDCRYERAWCNPPYSMLKTWFAFASEQSRRGAFFVCLVPSRTDTKAWHRYVWNKELHKPRPGVEVRFVEGRLKFGGCENSAPFPSAVVIFRPTTEPEP